MKDDQLITLIKSNPQEGLSTTIDLYGGTVKWIILKILGNYDCQYIEECVSDVFVKLWKNLDNFDSTLNISLKSYMKRFQNQIGRYLFLGTIFRSV